MEEKTPPPQKRLRRLAWIILILLVSMIAGIFILILLGPSLDRLTNRAAYEDPLPCQTTTTREGLLEYEPIAVFPLPPSPSPITPANAADLVLVAEHPVPDSLLSYHAGFYNGEIKIIRDPGWNTPIRVTKPDRTQSIVIIGRPSESAVIHICATDRTQITAFRADETANAAAYTPDGNSFIINEGRGTLRIYDSATLKKTATWNVREGSEKWHPTRRIAISPDGSLAAFFTDYRVALWDLTHNQQITILSGHTDLPIDLFFTPDGTHLITYGMDDTLRIWAIP